MVRLILANFEKRRRIKQSIKTPEQQALAQLTALRARLSSLSFSQHQKHAYRYFKRLKTIMVVYFKERFGVTVKETIDAEKMDELRGRFAGQTALFNKYKALFDEIENVGKTGAKYSDMCETCNKAISILEKA
jgi:hypothetical protein